ncbi:DUF2809 domain-containing protein [Neorhizobium alkalisoli]|uniref:Uncharacterized protein DUF2809 n=1 Tax=Neorhizobium alkalisoli TaxID=528178 RepID=A0A561R1M3_9HYPH|nr:DUF2809 domain-containing protein [Neorhizobium alkalisoli]TWF56517.1 uncharacterized protein DUF2809 [Neorhizobium alkalisoli]
MAGKGISKRRLGRLLAALCVILLGLLLRRFGYDLGLPFLIVKYGGSILWGAMVFLIVACLAGLRRPIVLVTVALLIAIAVEFSRLYQTPALDAFRLTLAGKLLLGRVFSLWNILAYAIGIALAAVADAMLTRVDRDQ